MPFSTAVILLVAIAYVVAVVANLSGEDTRWLFLSPTAIDSRGSACSYSLPAASATWYGTYFSESRKAPKRSFQPDPHLAGTRDWLDCNRPAARRLEQKGRPGKLARVGACHRLFGQPFWLHLTFFMMFFFPVTVLLGTHGTGSGYFRNDVGKVAGLVGATISAAALTGPLLLTLRRWRLPLGAVSAVLCLSILGATILDYEQTLMIWLAIGMAVPALAVDFLAWQARPSSNPNSVRWLAPAIPFLLYGGYYTVLLPTVGSTWSVHMWTSTIVIPTLVCWLLSFLLVPPKIPSQNP